MATKVTLKRKMYTQWDETDNLKRMKDADILAEKKKQTTNYGSIATNAAGAAVAAGTGGAIYGAFKGGQAGKAAGTGILNGMKSGMGKYGKTGLAAGAVLGAGYAYAKSRKQAKENEFYNKRLAYAQKQALRREKKDWKTNMTQRDGYSY